MYKEADCKVKDELLIHAQIMLILNGKNPMSLSIYWDILNLKLNEVQNK